MKKRVVYRSGLWIEGAHCTKCMKKRNGYVMQNRSRWVIYATCGHLLMRGPVLPVEALERMRVVNQKQKEDPRARWAAEHKADEERKKKMELLQYEASKIGRTRQKYG